MSRKQVMSDVAQALSPVRGTTPLPPVRLRIPETNLDERIAAFRVNLESLSGHVEIVASPEQARERVAALTQGRPAVASGAPLLDECGIPGLTGVESTFPDAAAMRDACSRVDFGITGANYALADTGTLVFYASREEPRLISLLPPVHIAVIRRTAVLSGLDELFTLNPAPASRSSSMVLVTGPSRTADIEQFLVRGVHGPGEIYVIII
jgi:L-lactate dehydrogenase complex protein LldG